jgi:hypothetical protein
MRDLTKTEKEVVNYLIAKNEGIQPPLLRIYKYLQAFTGSFSPDMPFTFYFFDERKPIMYVRDMTKPHERSSHTAFFNECAKRKPKIEEITGFYEYLVDNGYVKRFYKGLAGRPELPKQYHLMWRRYNDFYSGIMIGLTSVCLSEFVPKLKLYELWRSIQQ